ncbi:hypothetical protein KIW84_076115, partial [Lathyrus oleraceus]
SIIAPYSSKTKMMLKKQSHLFSFSLAILISLLDSTTITLSQLSPANAPIQPTLPAPTQPAASPKPLVPSLPESPTDSTPDTAGTAVDIVGILRKAKSFNVLIRLMKTTQLINQLNSQLLTTKTGGLTILAPDDSAFSELKAGFLNSLSDGQKLELLQFHVISDYVSSSNFDILTNPVRTLAGAKPGKVELNVVSYGGSVNISTVAKAPRKGPALAPEPSALTPKAEKEKPLSPDSSDSSVKPTNDNSGNVKISVSGKLVVSLVFGAVLVSIMGQ